jgi:hypothetical protein
MVSPVNSLFQSRIAVLATMHRKEQAIAPLLESAVGLKVVIPEAFNTDQFGTFTREIPRPGPQLATARLKVEAALSLTGEILGLASEGSFGPHPSLPFLASNRELVVLIDRHHDLEIVGEALSTATNYQQTQVQTYEAVQSFATKVGFPDHGLVVMANSAIVAKGIVCDAALQEAVHQAFAQTEVIHLETDMRAMYNPTRMKVIAQATQNLIEKLQSFCPQCGYPGFTPVERRSGLPCGLCFAPTALTRSLIYGCQRCEFRQEQLYPDGVETADPGQCAYCNP